MQSEVLPGYKPRVTDRIRVLHVEGARSVCLWFEVYGDVGRLQVYREWYPEVIGPRAFAEGICQRTPEAEEIRRGDMDSYCDEGFWADGSYARTWRDGGVYCSRVLVPAGGGWLTLVEYLSPAATEVRDGQRKAVPRVQALADCATTGAALQSFAFDTEPHGDLLACKAVLVACLAMPAGFADHRDPAAEDEARRAERYLREFGVKAYEEFTGKKAPRSAYLAQGVKPSRGRKGR